MGQKAEPGINLQVVMLSFKKVHQVVQAGLRGHQRLNGSRVSFIQAWSLMSGFLSGKEGSQFLQLKK